MIQAIKRFFLGDWCESHQRYYRTDFCPRCTKVRAYRDAVTDRRPPWLRSEGSWPTNRTKS